MADNKEIELVSEIFRTVDDLKDDMNNNDWFSIEKNFRRINGLVMRCPRSKIPNVYLRTLISLNAYFVKESSLCSDSKAVKSVQRKLIHMGKQYRDMVAQFQKDIKSIKSLKEKTGRSKGNKRVSTLIKDTFAVAQENQDHVEAICYKPQDVYDALQRLVSQIEEHKAVTGSPTFLVSDLMAENPAIPENCRTLLNELFSVFYKYGTERTIDHGHHATLCETYHYAIMDELSNVQNLLGKKNLQNDILNKDMLMKSFFNRAVCQVGLCAFRDGKFEASYSCISELLASEVAEELLAQGFSHFQDPESTPDMENFERRQLARHIQIDVGLLEAVRLVCAMLLGVPNKVSSKKTFTGPYKVLRQHIFDAAIALHNGDFKHSFDIIKGLDIWKCFRNQESVLEMLKAKIKEVALKS